MIKKYLFIAAFIVFYTAMDASAQDKGFGIGVKIGEPTGLSAKYWLGEITALDFSMGYSFIRDDRKLYLSCDYIYHVEDVLRSNERIPLYYGVGARFLTKEHDESSFGVRGVLGLDWLSRNFPVDGFIEVTPVFKLFPSTSLDFEAGIGFRYFFTSGGTKTE